MVGKIPKWESELWSCVSSGDGEHCPLYSHCPVKQRGEWCIDDSIERIKRLADCGRFNPASCDFMGCGTDCRMAQMLEMLVQGYIEWTGVRYPPVPTELVSLVDEHHTIEIRPLPLKAYHGAIWRLRGGWIIQVKEDDSPAMKRFAIFHEAFHILAHCRTSPVFRKRGVVQGSFNELLADAFAASVLAPTEWVKEKWAEIRDLDRMAKIFDVPKPVMCLRLKYLGLI